MQVLTFTIEGMKIVRELYVVHCFDVMFLSISKALRVAYKVLNGRTFRLAC